MAKAYLIGGAPRVGKSHLAIRVVRRHPMFAVSADSVREMLQTVLNPAETPSLFALRDISRHELAISHLLKEHPEKALTLQTNESDVVWPFINTLIESYLADGQDILVEGVQILPEHLGHANYSYSAVFLGNSSPEHSNEIALQAHKNPHDWLRRYTDGTVEEWARLVRRFSRYIEREADRNELPYLQTHDSNFEESMAAAEECLLASSR